MNHASKQALIALATVSLFTAACAKKKVATAPPPPPQPTAAAPAATPKPASPVVSSAATTPPAAAPASRYPNATTRARIDELLAKIEDAYFDYDKASLRPDAMKALQADSTELRDILKDYPDYKLTIEGHCDERGSAEYNVGLGDRRAAAVVSEYVPVAVNCCVSPLPTVGFAGVTAIDCCTAAVTVSTVDPLTAPRLALMVLVPVLTGVASPVAPMATEGVADAHVTCAVRFGVLLSE
jgi:peptidoglycan-associated lipoprotein